MYYALFVTISSPILEDTSWQRSGFMPVRRKKLRDRVL
jgi:hypothetical protein